MLLVVTAAFAGCAQDDDAAGDDLQELRNKYVTTFNACSPERGDCIERNGDESDAAPWVSKVTRNLKRSLYTTESILLILWESV
jgi:hypothetical protein